MAADVRLDVEAEGAQALALFRRVEAALTAVEKRIDGTTRATDRQRRSTQQATQQFSIYAKVAIAIAAIRRAQSVVGTITEINTRIVELGEATGVSIPVLQTLTRVLQEDGISADQFNKSVRRVFISIGEARRGVRRKIDSLTELGITYQELIDLAPDELFFRISEGLANLPDDYARATFGADLFGARNSQIATTLARYGENLEEASDRQARFGLVTSDNAIRLKSLDQTLTDVGNRLESTLGNEIGRLADDIGEIADTFSEDLNAGIRATIRTLEDLFGAFEDTEQGIQVVRDVVLSLGGAATIAALTRFVGAIGRARGQMVLFTAAGFALQKAISVVIEEQIRFNNEVEERLVGAIDRDLFGDKIDNLEGIASSIGIATTDLERVRNDIIDSLRRFDLDFSIDRVTRPSEGFADELREAFTGRGEIEGAILSIEEGEERFERVAAERLRAFVESRRELYQVFNEIPEFISSFNDPNRDVTSSAEDAFREYASRIDNLVRRGASEGDYRRVNEEAIRYAGILVSESEKESSLQQGINRFVSDRAERLARIAAIEENKVRVLEEINTERQKEVDAIDRQIIELDNQLEVIGLGNRGRIERVALQEAELALSKSIREEEEEIGKLVREVAEAREEEMAVADSEALVQPLQEERLALEANLSIRKEELSILQQRHAQLGLSDDLVQRSIERQQRQVALDRREAQPGIDLDVFNTLADADRDVTGIEQDLFRAREDAINNLVRQTQTAQESIDELTLASDEAIDRAVERAVGQQREQEILDISRQLVDARANLLDLYERYAAAVQSGDESAIQSAQREFQAAGRRFNRLTELFDLVESGAISYQEYADAVREVLLAQQQLGEEEEAAARRLDETNRRLDIVKSIAETVGSSLADAFIRAFDEGEKFDDLLESIARNLGKLLLNQAFDSLFANIFPAAFGTRGATPVAVVAGAASSAASGSSLPSIGGASAPSIASSSQQASVNIFVPPSSSPDEMEQAARRVFGDTADIRTTEVADAILTPGSEIRQALEAT